jgi:hypothetical protein
MPQREKHKDCDMKKLNVLGALALSLLIIVFSVNTISAQTYSPYTTKVVSTDGYVGVKYAGTGTFVTLSPGNTVGIGDIIETDSKGKVELKLPDGSILIIGENSRVVIKELGMVEVMKVTKSTFELVKGKIRAIVIPFVSTRSEFTIETNNATLGVRGTDFGETYDPDLDTTYILGMTGTLSLSLKHFPETPPIIIQKDHEISVSGGNEPGALSDAKKETIDRFLKGMDTTEERRTDKVNLIDREKNRDRGDRGRGNRGRGKVTR